MKMNRFIAVVLCFVMVFAMGTSAGAAESKSSVAKFQDCDTNAWYVPAMEFAIDNGLMQGVGNGLMEPDRQITRAEFVAVLCRLFDTYKQADISAYTDADEDEWYYEELAMGVQMGIIEGVSETELAPKEPLTREQAWTILARIMALPDGEAKELVRFGDKNDIGDWAVGAGAAMVIQGRLQGYLDGLVRPKQNITRAETAQLLMRCFPNLQYGGTVNKTITDNMLLLSNGKEPTELWSMNVKATLILGNGLADGRVDLWDADIGRLVCWGSHDVYIYPGCHLDEITIARTDGPCIIHWMGSKGNLPPVYITGDEDSKVVDNFGQEIFPTPKPPYHPVYTYAPRVYFYPQNDGSTRHIQQNILENGLVEPVEVPDWKGHVFGGWYYEPECETRFSFTQTVEDGLKLYGKWYTDKEWEVIDTLNTMANQGRAQIECETDFLATIGEDAIPCLIKSGNENKGAMKVTLVLTDTGAEVAVIDSLAVGETAQSMRVLNLPEYGNYPVKLVCQYLDSGEQAEIEGMLYVAYLWNRGV